MVKVVQFLVALAVIALLAPHAGGIDAAFAQIPVAPSPPPIDPAPGPIAGAGLPFLVIAYGAYWLVRRYRRTAKAL